MFWNKPKRVYDEKLIEAIIDRMKTLEAKIARLEAETMDIMISQHTMRDKVMKKIRINEKKNEEEEPTDTWNGLPLG